MNAKAGLAPIVRHDARVLILGSLPGDASLLAAQYYAHPRNHFWTLLSDVIGKDLVAIDYIARIDALKAAKIALWDVVAGADRHGSLDQQIRNVQLNDVSKLITQLPKLRAIAFNGKKAGALAGNAVCGRSVAVLQLPSTSPANTLNIGAKRAAWMDLSSYLTVEDASGPA